MDSLSDSGFIDLGIRGVQRRLRGARMQTMATNVIGRLIAVGAIVWLSITLFDLIDFDNTAKFPEGHLLDTLKMIFIFIQLIVIVLFTLPFLVLIPIVNTAGTPQDAVAILNTVRAFLNVDLFNNVDVPVAMQNAISNLGLDDLFAVPSSATVPDFLFSPFARYFSSIFSLEGDLLKTINRASLLWFAIILLGIAILAFIFRADMRSAATAFVLSQFIVFYTSVQLLFRQDSPDIFSFTPSSSWGDMFSSNVVMVALASYMFLEISLQISYISQILNPTQNRHQRVLRSLDRLKDFRLGVVSTDTAKITPEVAEGGESDDSDEKQASKSITSTGSSVSRKFGFAGVALMIDKASDSLFAKPGGQKDKLTSRLQRYHDGLVASDSTIDDKLVGASVAISPLMTIVYVLVSVVFRVGIMIVGLYVILNPNVLLFVLRYPASIYNSLEMYEPEGVVLLLIPIVVFILLFTVLIGFIQERLSSRLESAIEPVLDVERQYQEAERTGIVTEGGLSPVEDDELFYQKLREQLSAKEE